MVSIKWIFFGNYGLRDFDLGYQRLDKSFTLSQWYIATESFLDLIHHVTNLASVSWSFFSSILVLNSRATNQTSVNEIFIVVIISTFIIIIIRLLRHLMTKTSETDNLVDI